MSTCRDDTTKNNTTHVAFLPSAGVGHLNPFLRFAALLLHRHGEQCRITLITADNTVSDAESRLITRFLSHFPQVSHLTFTPIPIDLSCIATTDPFWRGFETLRQSFPTILPPILASLSPSALIHDISLITPVASIAESLSIPAYVFFTSCARMLSLFSHFPAIAASAEYPNLDTVTIPGVAAPIKRSTLPPLLLDPSSYFTHIFQTDPPKLTSLSGVLINTLERLESESLSVLKSGKIVENFPALFSVGPLEACEFERPVETTEAATTVEWLDAQPEGSVVYVAFGNRVSMPREQLKEIGEGLVRSECRFLWVVKDKKVDKEDQDGLEEILGEELLKRVMERGLVVKHWVDQSEILRHRAVGGFFSHGGWNSVVEAALYGVRMLTWSENGDQRVNSEVVRESGIGMWVESWGMRGGGGGDDVALVKGVEIGERIREMMGSQELRSAAAEIEEAAREAVRKREEVIQRLIGAWKMY